MDKRTLLKGLTSACFYTSIISNLYLIGRVEELKEQLRDSEDSRNLHRAALIRAGQKLTREELREEVKLFNEDREFRRIIRDL
jgi:hypothetical protein